VKHVTRLRAIATAGAASLLAVGVVTATTAASAKSTPPRVNIAGSHPLWASAKAKVSNTAVSGSAVTANVYLAANNASGLTAYAKAVSTPGSRLYGHYLTPAQVQRAFAPTASQISGVKSWLTGAGLSVTKVVPGIGGYVQVRGSTSAAALAFSVTFGAYKGSDNHIYRAPDQAASAPASISGDIVSVTGLDTARHLMKPAETLPPPGQNYFVAPTCAQYYGQKTATKVAGSGAPIPTAYGKAQPWTVCGYTPAQIRGAYGVASSGMTGKGVTVAVVDAFASPTMATDANLYARATGDKPFRSGQYAQVLRGGTNGWQNTGPDACDAAGWYGEEALDVEAVHGMAPDAHVTYVGAIDCTDAGLADALAYIVNHHTADIVTNSWGEPYDTSTMNDVYDLLFQVGAVEGMGFFFSSGDSGYEDPAYEQDPAISDKIQVDYPASSPWITSVGGTSLAIGKSANYKFETSWGAVLDPLAPGGGAWSFTPPGTTADLQNFYGGSGGGGVSTVYAQPWYQKVVVPRKLATAVPEGTATTPMRVIPDVAALADPSTGILVGETLFGPNNSPEKFYLSRIGGTSVASPIFAGIEADAQQAARHPLGFANPVIYALAAGNKFVNAFHDVTDHPQGPGHLAEVRSNYTDPFNKVGPLVTYLRTLGINGVGPSALPAVTGYDDATGVGSPEFYVQAFRGFGFAHR
jgi:subtilase family serine protease